MKTIKVLIVEDHALVRAGLRALLERIPGIDVIAEAVNGAEAIEMVRKRPPDVVFMDIAMPVLDGLKATSLISSSYPEIRIIMVSMYAREEYVREAMAAGAAGYLVKRGATGELERAIRAVVDGATYISPEVARDLSRDPTGSSRTHDVSLMTPRQNEVLRLIAEGRSTTEIASILKISAKTVETHRANLMDRLNIHDVPGLVRFAIRAGLVSLDGSERKKEE